MASPALLQDDQGYEQDADGRYMPNYSEHQTEGTPQLKFDDKGQTAADRQNDKDSQEHNSRKTTDDHGNESSPNVYPTPHNRIHDRLVRDTCGMYDDDNGPDPASDPRLMKLMSKQHNSSDDSSSSSTEGVAVGPVRRDRRRKSINNEVEGFGSELADKFRPMREDLNGEKECSTELEGSEVR